MSFSIQKAQTSAETVKFWSRASCQCGTDIVCQCGTQELIGQPNILSEYMSDKGMPSHPDFEASTTETSMTRNKISKISFSKVTKLFFYYITIFGFRTFAFPGEFYHIAFFSPIGILFSLPAFGLGLFHIYYIGSQCMLTAKIFGFFNGQTSVLFEMLFAYIFLFDYLCLSLICTPKIVRLIKTLDTMTISAKSWKEFSIFSNIAFLAATVLHIICCIILIKSYYEMMLMTGTSLLTIDYITFYSIIYATAAALFPLAFFAIFVFFLDRAFSEHLAAIVNYPKNKLEEQLPLFYDSYLKLADIVEEADDFFGHVTLGMSGVALINISTFLLNIGNLGILPHAMIYSMMFIMVFNFLGYSFLCIRLNEKSRAVGVYLHEVPPLNPNIYRWVDTFYRKVADERWGLTVGKFFLLERTAFVGLVSAMVTFLALYAQFAESATPGTNSTSINMQSYIQQSHAIIG